MPNEPRFPYGGQAVIEGVMIRGRRHFSLAVRRADGSIYCRSQPLNRLYTGPMRRLPLVRGVLALVETLALGVRALNLSANLATQGERSEDSGEIPGWMLGVTLAVALAVGIGVFFLLPLMAVWALDPVIPTGVASDIIEGVLRLALLLGYIWAIGFLRDIKRVFAYHGAEHMAVHAHEAGLPLDVPNVRRFGTPHPRCGTAFLLTVMLVSIIVFALLMAPSMEWRILSRVLLVPVIATISYEIIRFSGSHQHWRMGRMLSRPGLLLQRLTTRQPDDAQIEVAISAMEAAITADAAWEHADASGTVTALPASPAPVDFHPGRITRFPPDDDS